MTASNDMPEPRSFHKSTSHLRVVPDTEEATIALVKRFARILENEETSGGQFVRRSISTSAVLDAIYCLSPKAVECLKPELVLIVECSINSDIRTAAALKLCESEVLRPLPKLSDYNL